ncbi:hypothetical protein [Saccharopolyspora spinosa]|uniref:hypothetical protein n=1 Tax=Saccharopolyspora spinosa TaxID=60894 RepID=UPI000237A425|nr:hypothetical protein [Saccharopolyspora spinosa]
MPHRRAVDPDVPGILFLLPLSLIYATVGQVTGIALHGSHLGLVITYLAFSLPFCTNWRRSPKPCPL